MTSRLLGTAAAAAFLLTTFDTPVTSVLAQSGKPVLGTFGIDTAQMDTAVKPGDDFFRYVNGTWLTTFKIPADRAALRRLHAAQRQGRRGCADAGHGARRRRRRRPAPSQQKVVDLYGSWMDQARVEARGIEPLAGRPGGHRKGRVEDGSAAADGPAGLHGAVRRLHHPGPGRPEALRRRDHPGRARHAGPRLLPEHGREVRRLPRRLQDLRHARSSGWSATRRRPRAPPR